jgi:hypothetical protein
MRANVSLLGYKDHLDVARGVGAAHQVADDPLAALTQFLEFYETAKIVFILDTHASDNGCFMYDGNTKETYAACSLEEVRNIETAYDLIVNHCADYQRLSASSGASILLGQEECPKTQTPLPNPQPCVWSDNQQRGCTL